MMVNNVRTVFLKVKQECLCEVMSYQRKDVSELLNKLFEYGINKLAQDVAPDSEQFQREIDKLKKELKQKEAIIEKKNIIIESEKQYREEVQKGIRPI